MLVNNSVRAGSKKNFHFTSDLLSRKMLRHFRSLAEVVIEPFISNKIYL